MHYFNIVGVVLSVVGLLWDRGSGGAHRISLLRNDQVRMVTYGV